VRNGRETWYDGFGIVQGGYGMGDEEKVEPWMAGRVA
jgi:hypothetical protein